MDYSSLEQRGTCPNPGCSYDDGHMEACANWGLTMYVDSLDGVDLNTGFGPIGAINSISTDARPKSHIGHCAMCGKSPCRINRQVQGVQTFFCSKHVERIQPCSVCGTDCYKYIVIDGVDIAFCFDHLSGSSTKSAR